MTFFVFTNFSFETVVLAFATDDTYRFRATYFTRNMKEYEIFSGYDVGHAVSVIGDWTKSTTSRDALRIFLDVKSACLAVRRLRCRQPPRLAQHRLCHKGCYGKNQGEFFHNNF